jgi:2-aminobenzoate-CoA ligase
MSGNKPTRLHPSAHLDTFCRDHLPPTDQWPDLVFDLPELQYPERLNCAVELVDVMADRHGRDRTCLRTPSGERWSYGDVVDRSNQVARVLVEDHQIVPGNRVLLRGPNNPWLAACLFGVMKAGAVAVTTMPMLRSGELATVAEITRPSLALCDHRFVAELAVAGIEGPIVAFGSTSADDLTASATTKPVEFDAVPTSSDDVVLLALTSGTTGRPKATMHFHRDLLAIADTFSAHLLRPTSEDIFTGTPPLAFTFGLGAILIFPLRVGASTLLIEKATPDELADLIVEHNVSICSTAPTGYRAMLASGKAASLRSLRRAVSAGEHLPEATWHAFAEAAGVRLIDGIGATEMLHIFISAADDDIRPGATGVPVPGYQAAILDPAGVPVPPGTLGRLAVKGPTGCRYLNDARQTVYVQNGWNITGDTYVQDSDGYFIYQARSDDMIISAGYNIAGPEVEEALLAHDNVLECCVVGVPDEAKGQIVKAFVVARGRAGDGDSDGDDEARARELIEFAKQRIAPYKCPRVIEFVASLPRTATGKLQRYVMREGAAT